MRYAGIMPNDFINGTDVSVSYWTQGCPFHCPGCHNPETWDFNSGYEATEEEVLSKIEKAVTANGLERNLSILGGEPLCEQNIDFVIKLIKTFRTNHPNKQIYLWTGYVINELTDKQKVAVVNCDVVIDGPYVEALRDVSLELRGSANQKIHYMTNDPNI